MKKAVVVMGMLMAVAIAAATAMYVKVRQFDAAHNCNVLSGVGPSEKAKREVTAKRAEMVKSAEKVQTEAKVKEEAKDEKKKMQLEVEEVKYDENRRINVYFTERPDMDVIGNYIKVGPMLEGRPTFRYCSSYSYRKQTFRPCVSITGDFAYRTNITLIVRKGLPLYGKGANPHAEGSTTNDFVKVFRRADPDPAVDFADEGRYLPPGGRQAIRVSAISVTNIYTEICRVEPRNVVQLLAREERKYRICSWQEKADVEETQELSGECVTGMIHCVNRPCEKETHLMPIAINDGGPRNGVFLACIRNADRPRKDYSWYGQTERNPNFYRLVCLSDLGLSVRKGQQNLGVWVTSLTTGRPVSSAQVEVYSSANILLATGTTDANGWCEIKPSAAGEPFAVIVRNASDMTFMALESRMQVDETDEDGARPDYLAQSEVDCFIWSERGIYRHDERIMVHGLVRDISRQAPKRMPLVLELKNPNGNVYATKTVLTDDEGAFVHEDFRVLAEQPSGKWNLQVRLPGKNGKVLGERTIKVEEFAPPQIMVSVQATEDQHPTNFTFRVCAEHLFGGPASSLACEGAVVFEDVPFAPKQWKGFSFGNDDRGLKPCFRRLSQRTLDNRGQCEFFAPLWADSGRPKAAVRATGQGVVFEDGGRPATSRKSVICHYYPFYIGADLPSWLKNPTSSRAKIHLVCVDSQGELLAYERRLVGRIDRIESNYSYRQDSSGRSTWDCDRVRETLIGPISIAVGKDGRAEYELPQLECGDYVLTVEDVDTGASFAKSFYLSDWGDDTVRAPLSNPTEVTIIPNKAFYRTGETPHLIVKSPFAGYAILSVLRDDRIYEEVLNLTNATSEVVLRPVERDWAPNVDVAISVIQSVAANAKHLAARAHGKTIIKVRPAENEIDVRLQAKVDHNRVIADLVAPGATYAVVTLVDEGINLLTGEATPDPIAHLARPRNGFLALYDLYGYMLPVADDALRANGVKTGGGFGAEMLGRVSPVPTRRFKPLVLWQRRVALKDGMATVAFDLPEFVGEVRLTALAYSKIACGATSIRQKVAPKIVMQPDAPRFVAPGDEFDVTLTLRNTTSKPGRVRYVLGDLKADEIKLNAGESTNVVCRVKAPHRPGEMALRFCATGLGETHRTELLVPVRPAVAWRESAEVQMIAPGERFEVASDGLGKFALQLSGTPVAELIGALTYLAEYPHGCLEQTVSRIFPLITAGGILNAIASPASSNRTEFICAGVHRVESMIRAHDFVMWPDCDYAPWDREVSLYAAHFLIEAEKSGEKLRPESRTKVIGFLRKWLVSTNRIEAAYACHTLALAGEFSSAKPGLIAKDRMLQLYDQREDLDALSRARLARAFVALHDRKRAEALMAYALEPQSIREAAFEVLALTDLDPDDQKLPKLIEYLLRNRDKARCSWGTTMENSHALLAIGAFYQHHPPVSKGEPQIVYQVTERGTTRDASSLTNRQCAAFWAEKVQVMNDGKVPAYLSWRKLELPAVETVTNEHRGIFLSRRYLRPDGEVADLSNLIRGEMLIAELTITSDVDRVIGDLVVEDLFAGAFEPVHRELAVDDFKPILSAPQVADWIMRKDARDDRMLVFSKSFRLNRGHEAKVCYPIRVVSAGDFVLPAPSVEGMYNPALHSRGAAHRIVVRH